MRAKVVVPLVLAVALVAGLFVGDVVDLGRVRAAVGIDGRADPDARPTSPSTPSGRPSGSPPASPDPGTTPAVPVVQPNLENYPITRLAPGEEPPQFVVVSFDGACDHTLFRHWYDLGASTGSRFTFFMSGLCLLPEGDREQYRPPGKPRGYSAIGFADPAKVDGRIQDWSLAWESGHGVGTHFLGHFCDANGVGTWSAADWRSEMDQAARFLDDWKTYNADNPDADLSLQLPFSFADVEGDRTPCLQGKREQMYKAFATRDFRYDSSSTGSLQWPSKVAKYSLWEFPLPMLKLVGKSGGSQRSIAMDYNILYQFTEGRTTTSAAESARIRKVTYDSLMAALGAVYDGNRAPLFIGNHFNTWARGAFRDSLTDFVTDAHDQYPSVRFVSFEYLVRWLDAQSPSVLKALQARPAQTY